MVSNNMSSKSTIIKGLPCHIQLSISGNDKYKLKLTVHGGDHLTLFRSAIMDKWYAIIIVIIELSLIMLAATIS